MSKFVPAELARPAIKALEQDKSLTAMEKVKKATDVLQAAEARLAAYDAETRRLLREAPDNETYKKLIEERTHRAQMIKHGIEAGRLVVKHFHAKHRKEISQKQA